MISWIVAHILAVCIGISLGLMGGGGSVLAVPTLVYILKIPPKEAIVLTLVAVGFVSLLGAIPHWKLGNVQLKTAAIFGASTMVGAYTGARLATLPFVTDTLQMSLFAIMMLIAAVLMIIKSRRLKPSEKTNSQEINKNDLYQPPVCRYCWLWLLTEGIGVGILTGLVGVGGGFAIVPALVLLAKLPMKQAIGTSLVIIALNSVAGFLGYLGHIHINLPLLISFTLAASIGMSLGAYLVRFVQAKHLQKAFGYFLLTMAAFIFWQNKSGYLPTKSSHDVGHNQVYSSAHSIK